MNDTPANEFKNARFHGAAGILGAILLIIATTIFVLTHGSQTEAQTNRLFGLKSAQYSKIFQPTIWFLFMICVIGLKALGQEYGNRLVKIGHIVSVIGYGLTALSWISQTWIVDPDLEFESMYVQGGFALGLVSFFVQSAGMILFGAALKRANAPSYWFGLPLTIGIMLIPLLIFQLFVFDWSDGGLMWNLIYILPVVPYALCWVALGYRLWSQNKRLIEVKDPSLTYDRT